MIHDHESIDVFIGIDVGKTSHHAVALNRAGKKLLDKALPQDEAKLKTMITSLSKNGKLLFVVDQPATIGALPQTLRSVQMADAQVAKLAMLCGFDDDLAKQATATSNRIRVPLTQIHPALERAIGPHLDHPALAELLAEYPTPTALRKAEKSRVEALMRKHAPRVGKRWTQEAFPALDDQTVLVSGTSAAGIVLPHVARALDQTRAARAEVLEQVEKLVQAHPLHQLLTSMPAVGARAESRILIEVVGKDFTTAGHLGSSAGPGMVTGKSGTSIRGDPSARKGNQVLKRALFLSAFAALKGKGRSSRAYYDRKCAEGKKHNQAVIALARRRCNVLFALLRDGAHGLAYPAATLAALPWSQTR